MSIKQQFRDTLGTTPDGRLPFLVNDMVIEEQLCQMRCSYCLTEEYNLLMNVPDARLRLTSDDRSDWHRVIDAYDEHVDSPILRISGGEFFWLKGSTEFIARCSSRYETIQIITNGVFLTAERLKALAEIGNAQVNISLDGHTQELNRHRLPPKQAKLLDLILRNLGAAVEAGLPVEIQSVLTDANAGGQEEFADYLKQRYDGKVTLYVFPVRGDTAKVMGPPPGDHLRALVERYDELSGVLPPRAYVENVADQVKAGTRTLPCFVTATMVQLFGQGDVSACPHAWLKPMGNIKTEPQLIELSYAQHAHYDLFMQERPRFPFCKTCATPSDVLNLYLLGKVTDEEMSRTPLYSGPRTLARLNELRTSFIHVTGAPSLAG